MDNSIISRINPSNMAYGTVMNYLTRVDNTTASRAGNSGKTGEPAETLGSNTGELALGRVLQETVKITNAQGGKLPIIGSPANKQVAAAAVPWGGRINILV